MILFELKIPIATTYCHLWSCKAKRKDCCNNTVLPQLQCNNVAVTTNIDLALPFSKRINRKLLGLKWNTSTSKAVVCAVISIAGNVITQPTAQTTTSAGEQWKGTNQRCHPYVCLLSKWFRMTTRMYCSMIVRHIQYLCRSTRPMRKTQLKPHPSPQPTQSPDFTVLPLKWPGWTLHHVSAKFSF